jgi:hypothetical protein
LLDRDVGAVYPDLMYGVGQNCPSLYEGPVLQDPADGPARISDGWIE